MRAVIYDVISGEILRIVWCPEPMDQLEAGEAFIESGGEVSGAGHYVSSMSLTPRPALPVLPEYNVSVGETLEFSVPAGTVASSEGAEVVADADGIDLSFGDTGDYQIKFRPPFPWQPATVQVQVS